MVFAGLLSCELPVRFVVLGARTCNRADLMFTVGPVSPSASAKSHFMISAFSHFSGRFLGLPSDRNATSVSTATASKNQRDGNSDGGKANHGSGPLGACGRAGTARHICCDDECG